MSYQALTYRTARATTLAALFPILLLGCDSSPIELLPNPDPEVGATDFLSADGVAGQDAPNREPAPGVPDENDGGDAGDEAPSTVEEGDIYRTLGEGLLLNLNAYRGLQIIDVSDVANPTIIGRLQVTGTPVEMYVVDDRAIVLMNNWRGYYGVRDDIAVETREGGLVLMVDISDRKAPVAVAQDHVPGWIQTSRLTRSGDQAALFVAANEWGEIENDNGTVEYGSRTVVKSFDVSGDEVRYRTELNLGGYVSAIQATPTVLLVARQQGHWNQELSEVTVIDIANPDGTMVPGDTVAVDGYVNSQFHMDFHNDMLRVFSGPRWGANAASTLQTFAAANLAELTPIDSESFGTGDQLYAAIFLGNKAFAVTYLRVDPFHAFEITDEGQVTEMSEYVVSGWNDFFRPVLDDTRLIGIGVNDENGRAVAVSMYDVTDLTNIEPLLQRAEISGEDNDWSWSEANWDHRAFTVLDNAVAVQAATGETETGLVLLPFSAWNWQKGQHTSAVQIYTFSSTTLTRRGVMQHGTPVRRSFVADETTTINLSEADLSLFDHTDVDQPVEMGRLELAPNYTGILTFGDFRARIKNNAEYHWYYTSEPAPPAQVEIIPRSEHAESATPVASFDIPAGAQVYKLGDLLVTVTTVMAPNGPGSKPWETSIEAFDLANPSEPVRRGQLVTSELQTYGNCGYYGCFDYGWYYQPFATLNPVGQALTVLETETQQQALGSEHVCYTYIQEAVDCWGQDECTYWSGDHVCRSLNGGPEVCTGSFAKCTRKDNQTTCEPVAMEDVEAPLYQDCHTRPVSRYWQQYRIKAVDLSDPDNPVLAPTVELPRKDEGVSLLPDGDKLHVTIKRPAQVPNDPRPYVRYYVTTIDFANPSQPALRSPVNVPGELVAIADATMYTRDLVWGANVAETAIAQLELRDGIAHLQGHYRFADRQVKSVTIDERGFALVSHRPIWSYEYGQESTQMLTILAATNPGLSKVSEADVDTWAELREVAAHRALFQVPGGILVMSLEDPSSPSAQAYFPTRGWPFDILVDEDRVLFPAGRYGLYDFSLDTFNLNAPN